MRGVLRITRAFVCLLGALCVLCASVAHAQAPPSVSANPLKPLESFVGGTWVAEGELPGMGKYVAERTYRRTLEGKFIEFEQVTKIGTYRSAVKAILAWHPDKRKVVAYGFADDGTISITECDCTSTDTFAFQGRLIGGIDPGPVRGQFRRTGPDTLLETIEAERNGAWQPHGGFEFKRKPSPMTAAASASAPAAALKPLARLVGTWVQQEQYSGVRYTIELEFRWVLGGQFLMSEYRILSKEKSGLHALSFIGYDTEQKRLVQYGFSADGTILAARVSAAEGTPEMVFEGDMVGGTRRTLRITYRRPDDDTLTAVTEFQQQGMFQPAGNTTMRRQK